jgi:RNA polymerase sigma-70 factor, ECF subfamily
MRVLFSSLSTAGAQMQRPALSVALSLQSAATPSRRTDDKMDRTLVERARQGDHAAFTALAKQATDRLYGVATLILRDPDRAQDAVQEAFLSAWRDVRSLREPESWDAWLHRLVVRACYREAARHRRSRLPVGAIGWIPTTVDDAGASISDRDEIERGFQRLTVEERAILVLHFHVGLSAAETGTVLGCAEVAARSRLHRALRAMRGALEADARIPHSHQGRPA